MPIMQVHTVDNNKFHENQIADSTPAWEFVMINVGYGASGFSFNASGLQWDDGEGFSGWLGMFTL